MRATGLVLFLLLLAGLLLLLVQGPGTGPATSGGPAAAGPSGEGTESAPRVGEAGGSTPHRIQDRPQDPPRPAPVTVTGLVTGEGRPLTGARVFLHRAGGEPPPEKSDLRPSTADPLASTRTDAAGRYTLHLEAGVVPGTFDLGAWAPGWRRRLELDVPISAKGSRWDLLLTRGLVLAGRVVDPEGKPVAGMPLFACSHPDKWPSYFLGRPGRRESDNLVDRNSAFLVQSATTGPEGRFRFTGLEDRIYHFFTGRLGLALREPRSARAGGEGLELVAAPCYGLRVAVTDAGTGKPLDLAMCRIHIFHHDRCVRSTHISTSREVLDKWAPPPDPAGRVEYRLRFSAPRYIARNLSLKPPAGQLHATGRVALTRMEPEKGYPFLYRCRYVDGTPARIPLHLELRDEEGERVYSRTMEPRTPGTYQCRLPPGKWKVSVAPSVGLFGLLLSWEETIRHGKQGTTVKGRALPLFGRLEIHVPAGGEGSYDASYALKRARQAGFSVDRCLFETSYPPPPPGQPIRVHHIFPGNWHLTLKREKKTLVDQDFQVDPGATVAIHPQPR